MTRDAMTCDGAVQLPLEVGLRAEHSFDSFVAGPNALAVSALRQRAAGGAGQCYLWGSAGVGKTHLLEAACAERGADAIYLPMGRFRELGPGALGGLERIGLVCLDELEVVAGAGHWDEALFHLYNRVVAVQGALVVAARAAPSSLPGVLPDLRSRLAAGLVVQLRQLDDGGRRDALTRRARQPAAVATCTTCSVCWGCSTAALWQPSGA
jgi:DnaA family protein